MNQEMNKDIYKMYQLMEFFITKYNFNNVLVKEYIGKNEVWLANKNSIYSIIRITMANLDEVYSSKTRIEEYINVVSKSFKIKAKFLDIHICKDEVLKNEEFDTLCIDENYINGVDAISYYPLIDKVIHSVEKPEDEIANKITLINKSAKENLKAKKRKLKAKFKINATLIISIISIVVSFITLILSRKFDSTTAYILMGADYKFFTLGLHEFYRLFTYAFVHGSFIHLFCNIYSFSILGNYFEYKLGTVKYLIVVFFGIIFGSLTNGALTGNTLEAGLSAGIYSLFAMYVIDAFKTGAYHNPSFLIVLFINLSLNLQSGVAYQAHLGGAIAGIIFYYLYQNEKIDYRLVGLIAVCLIALIYKYVTSEITPLYTGTDLAVVDAFKQLKMNNISNHLLEKIYIYLSKVGG